jgi:hypothetical protein
MHAIFINNFYNIFWYVACYVVQHTYIFIEPPEMAKLH